MGAGYVRRSSLGYFGDGIQTYIGRGNLVEINQPVELSDPNP